MMDTTTEEPTLYDVIIAVQNGFALVDARFDHMYAEFADMKQDIRNLSRRQFNVELKDEDRADRILNHDERIIGLEFWRKGLGKKGLAGA